MQRRSWAVVDEWGQILLETKSFEQAFRFHLQMAPWELKGPIRIVPPSEPYSFEAQLVTRIS